MKFFCVFGHVSHKEIYWPFKRPVSHFEMKCLHGLIKRTKCLNIEYEVLPIGFHKTTPDIDSESLQLVTHHTVPVVTV